MPITKKKPIVKKATVKRRHGEVVAAFQDWLKKHPSAPLERQVKTFDAFCDSAILSEELKSLCRPSKT
jgi:hypothetical protein